LLIKHTKTPENTIKADVFMTKPEYFSWYLTKLNNTKKDNYSYAIKRILQGAAVYTGAYRFLIVGGSR